jgi:transmembrane 9 superfamily member 2/4
MMENSACNVLCSVPFPAASDEGDDVAFMNDVVASSYSVNWLIDGLPAARIRVDPTSGDRFYSVGFELGSVDEEGVSLLNNHYDIIVEYHV